MQTITHSFDDLEITRAWPVFVTCSGEIDVLFGDDEWWIGDVTINWFRQGDLVETVTYPAHDAIDDEHPRAERIRHLILHDSILCAAIDEAIEIEIASRRVLAEEARYDDARETAA